MPLGPVGLLYLQLRSTLSPWLTLTTTINLGLLHFGFFFHFLTSMRSNLFLFIGSVLIDEMDQVAEAAVVAQIEIQRQTGEVDMFAFPGLMLRRS